MKPKMTPEEKGNWEVLFMMLGIILAFEFVTFLLLLWELVLK